MALIVNLISDIGIEIWTVSGQMAPYLLFGFFMAGVLSVAVSPEFVRTHLGMRGLPQVVKAAALGVPLPLCSCGVLPVAASLRGHGASKGASLSFLVSTPQTGLDSIMVTHALLGPVVAVFRVVTAFVSGVLAGGLADLWDGADPDGTGEKPARGSCREGPKRNAIARALHYGFIKLAREIGRAMVVGMVLSGVLSAIVPENYFADKLGAGVLSMIVMMLAGIPLYVCSSGSVPIAYALMRMGVSPGAALVFLVTGPATNAAAVTTVWNTMGRRSAIVYLAAIAVCALLAGALLDQFPAVRLGVAGEHGSHDGIGLLNHLSAAALLLVLAPSFFRTRKPDLAAEAT